MKVYILKFYILISLSFALLNISCRKFLTPDAPVDRLQTANVFTNDNTAIATITGIYSEMTQGNLGIVTGNTTIYSGLCADELKYTSSNANTLDFFTNSIRVDNSDLGAYWARAYKHIYEANAAIEGIQTSLSISIPVKNQLLGEAKFIRAFCHFYLVNLFGDIPLILSADYRVNSTLPRTPRIQVFTQIIADLTEAQNLLNINYPTTEKVRPNKWTATALLARTYLYIGDWINAAAQSSAIINSGTYSPLPTLANSFLKNSQEAIWQILPVNSSVNTYEGSSFIPAANTIPAYSLTTILLNSFEANDQRKSIWTGNIIVNGQTYYYPYKYKIKTGGTPLNEYYTVFRLAEQYLIRAEARAQQNDITGAQADLNTIRLRAGLPATAANDKSSMLIAIEHERQTELFTEWGHRWLDLKRNNHADILLATLKAPNWQSQDVLWPIPLPEILANGQLSQNPGY